MKKFENKVMVVGYYGSSIEYAEIKVFKYNSIKTETWRTLTSDDEVRKLERFYHTRYVPIV